MYVYIYNTYVVGSDKLESYGWEWMPIWPMAVLTARHRTSKSKESTMTRNLCWLAGIPQCVYDHPQFH